MCTFDYDIITKLEIINDFTSISFDEIKLTNKYSIQIRDLFNKYLRLNKD